MRQGQRVGSPTEKVDEMRRGSCDEKQTGGFKGRVCNAAATMSVEAEDNGRCVSRQMETMMVTMIRCMRERWVRAWARASSGRGQASQSYLGSSRLGARVWGRKEGLEGWQQILSMLPACAESEGSPAGLRGQSDDNFGTHCCWLLLLAD